MSRERERERARYGKMEIWILVQQSVSRMVEYIFKQPNINCMKRDIWMIWLVCVGCSAASSMGVAAAADAVENLVWSRHPSRDQVSRRPSLPRRQASFPSSPHRPIQAPFPSSLRARAYAFVSIRPSNSVHRLSTVASASFVIPAECLRWDKVGRNAVEEGGGKAS